MEWFKYEDTDGDDIVLEINFNLLKVTERATTYNFKGEVVSRNKIAGWWTAKSKRKLFSILRNCIGNMPEETNKKYQEFVNELENKYKED